MSSDDGGDQSHGSVWADLWARHTMLLVAAVTSFYWGRVEAGHLFGAIERVVDEMGTVVGGERGQRLVLVLGGANRRLLALLASMRRAADDRQRAVAAWNEQCNELAPWIVDASRARHETLFTESGHVESAVTRVYANSVVGVVSALSLDAGGGSNDSRQLSDSIEALSLCTIGTVAPCFETVARPMRASIRSLLARVHSTTP